METLRYNRQMALPEIGEVGQFKLLNFKVLLIGVGGLGSAVLPYLVAAGIGEIGLVDDDVIEESNLQRQVIYKTNAVGKSKVQEAKKMALELNPKVKIKAIPERLSSNNSLQLFDNYDIIVDGTDNLSTKYLINDTCCVLNKPFVYGSVYRFEGQVSVFNYKNGPTYRCLYPNQNNSSPSCVEAGVVGISVGIIGMLQANEVIKLALGIGEVLSGKLLVYKNLNNSQEKFSFAKNEQLIVDKAFFDKEYLGSKIKNIEISISELLEDYTLNEALFLDVRNNDELPKISFTNYIQIPLSDLENYLDALDKTKEMIVFCQSGIRSKLAVELLRKHNFPKTKSVLGGVLALSKEKLMERNIV